ncbi:MAG TPA: glycosyltransferase family 2 protein [Xanthomonadaceae bacterium]|nr:glycosyltransferase family 2 protein [Xanthomonadaceae bacterium]
MTRPVSIVVPMFNAASELDACLASLQRHLPAGVEVLVADDASGDRRAVAIAQRFCEQRPDARYLRRRDNLGFVGNVNLAFAETGGHDLVLLNSDTVVTPGWLERLRACAASDALIASATPWSNNAEICSFPRFCEDNPEPLDAEAIAAAAASLRPEYPELPTAVGFCMYLARTALEAVGDFDAATFGRGYGEENDWCLRARAHGFRNVLCDDAYVVHRGGASFAPTGHAPGGENLRRLVARYPEYNAAVAAFIINDPLRPLRERLAAAIAEQRRSGPQPDLFDR